MVGNLRLANTPKACAASRTYMVSSVTTYMKQLGLHHRLAFHSLLHGAHKVNFETPSWIETGLDAIGQTPDIWRGEGEIFLLTSLFIGFLLFIGNSRACASEILSECAALPTAKLRSSLPPESFAACSKLS